MASLKLLKPRIPIKIFSDQTMGDKVHGQEGNSPDY